MHFDRLAPALARRRAGARAVHLAEDRARRVAMACVAAAFALSVFNVWTPYSYWVDELYSVAASAESFPDLFRYWILPDVHPPLYQTVLWGWTRLFGDGEPATRSLSLICAGLGLLGFMRFAERALPPMASALSQVVFATSWLVPFYAQETRSYAMVLLFSVALTTSWLDEEDERWRLVKVVVSGVALAWTHLFGTALAAIVLVAVLIEVRDTPERVALIVYTLGAVVVWPAVLVLSGTLGAIVRDGFWIESAGVHESIAVASRSLLPGFQALHAALPLWIVGGLGGVVLGTLGWGAWRIRSLRGATMRRRLALVVLGFVAVIAVVDRHTPLSTCRNYIVLLPALSLLVGRVASERLVPRYAGHLVLGIGLLGLVTCWVTMRFRWAPRENPQAVARFVVEADTGHNYYLLRPGQGPARVVGRLNNYYLEKLSGGTRRFEPITLAELLSLEGRFAVQLFHYPRELQDEVRDRIGPPVQVFRPPQHRQYELLLLHTGCADR